MQSQQYDHGLPIQAGLGPIVNVRANATAPRAGLGRDTTTDRVKALDASGGLATPSNSHFNRSSDEEDDVDDTRGLFSDDFDMDELEEVDNEEGTGEETTSVETRELQHDELDFEEFERRLNEELGGEGETRELNCNDFDCGDLLDAEGENDKDIGPDFPQPSPSDDALPPAPPSSQLDIMIPPTTNLDYSGQLLVEPLQLAATDDIGGPREDDEVESFAGHGQSMPNYEYVSPELMAGYAPPTGPPFNEQYSHWPQPAPAAPAQYAFPSGGHHPAAPPHYDSNYASQQSYYAPPPPMPMPRSYDAYYRPQLPNTANVAVNPHQQYRYPAPQYLQALAAGPQYAQAASNYPPPPPQRYGYSHNNAVFPNAGPQNFYPMPPPLHADAHSAYQPDQQLYPQQQQAAWAATPRTALQVPSRNANANTIPVAVAGRENQFRYSPYPSQPSTAAAQMTADRASQLCPPNTRPGGHRATEQQPRESEVALVHLRPRPESRRQRPSNANDKVIRLRSSQPYTGDAECRAVFRTKHEMVKHFKLVNCGEEEGGGVGECAGRAVSLRGEG
ncbi:hypothetical protein MIND_00627500 [Mycena indigotica]|uniref:Uncharacterized protein n=1 Tax=Mycena indigotica TaxID=2126181 RepID=A0A8H6SSA4_9AGAR|nr:uncharacterized protein MIND_00627500 [Mycena indigotica]KAF7303967.1 hypothetical protein MIND_00627500 [Mycena indigotica]